jgi:SAM-dependent methyltransferase
MAAAADQSRVSTDARARLSGGTSQGAIYAAVAAVLENAGATGAVVDVGCGRGEVWPFLRNRFTSYTGVDAVRYDGFPSACRLVRADLDRTIPLLDASADAVISVETIEHLENPRALARELVRIVKPGGWLLLSTPNQLSALSLLTLLLRGQHGSFQDVHYPAHLTALLEADLRRIASEIQLSDVRVEYTLAGRMPLTSRHYPASIARLAPRLLSDTVILAGRRSA